MRRPLTGIILAVAATATTACTSSNSSLVAPSSEKCEISASTSPASFGSSGGTGTIAISGARDCAWSIASDASWIAVEGETRGQGEAAVSYKVTANGTPVARRGTVIVESTRLEIAQEGAPCRFDLDRTQIQMSAAGGAAGVRVSAMSGCRWTAVSQASWITLSQGATGDGAADVTLSIARNTGSARTGSVTVAGQMVSVGQDGQASAPAPTPTPPAPPPSPNPPPAPSPPPPSTPPPPPAPTPVERIELDGDVSARTGACPDITFIVAGRIVYADRSTDYRKSECGEVQVGREVEVRGHLYSDGRVRADRIEVKGRGDDEDDDLVAGARQP